MSFVPFIRDYLELLNTVYDSFSKDINLQKIILETGIYLAQTIKIIIVYILTFQWFRDIIYLPIFIPEISKSILKETFFLQTPLENTFSLLEIPAYNSNKFLIGFLNSFFLALPISCAHLIYVRRFLIQGNVAGIAAGLGNIFGQLFFIGSVILGLRFFLIPWFSFEPLTFLLGIILLLTIVYDMVHERIIKIVDWSNYSAILKIFFLNFLLIWTEQSCIFQYLGNISFTTNSSIIESFQTKTYSSFLSTHCFYLFGLFLGSIFFNIVFAILIRKLTEFIQIKFAILRSTWIIRLNASLLTLTLAFTFTSIPFYGLDYLLTQPLGFISEDKAFKNTIFCPNDIKDPFGILSGFSQNLSSDVTSFDRGYYLRPHLFQSFEDLNYSGEYAWKIGQGNIPLFDQYKEKARRIRALLLRKTDSEKIYPTSFNSTDIESKNLDLNEKEKIKFEYPTYYPINKSIYFSSNIQRRFEDHYEEPTNYVFENILKISLNNVFSDERYTVLYPKKAKQLKQKFYSNPIYKFLLTTDIDFFLKRQPSEYILSPKEETDLYKKRLVLGRYNDSLRFYNKLSYTDEFQHFFNGSKSFADRVYNQQFKGTLHIVRRLFSISFDKNPTELIVKFDQPLYNFSKNLSNRNSLNQSNYHEELLLSINSPMFELIGQSPLYVGWDEELRKILITNRLLSRSITNYLEADQNDFLSKKENLINESKSIQFTTWPLIKNKLENIDSNIILNSRFLFETKNMLEERNYNNLFSLFQYVDKQSSGISTYQELPNNVLRLVYGLIDVIPPNRGGFIWPGASSLKFSLDEILKF